jgi:hypothetical protein
VDNVAGATSVKRVPWAGGPTETLNGSDGATEIAAGGGYVFAAQPLRWWSAANVAVAPTTFAGNLAADRLQSDGANAYFAIGQREWKASATTSQIEIVPNLNTQRWTFDGNTIVTSNFVVGSGGSLVEVTPK